MDILWQQKESYRCFDHKNQHINDTCGRFGIYIPYKRKYTTLNDEQLLQLIRDAKQFKWQALDLTSCGLITLPDELWDLPDLKMLYLGNPSKSLRTNQGEYSVESNHSLILSSKIELLTNLQVLSLSNCEIQFESEAPLNLPNLIHLDVFNCNFNQVPEQLLIRSIQEIGFNCLETSLSENFFELRNLKRAYLTGSAIESLPDKIGELLFLQHLYLFRTKIASLPHSMAQLRYLSKLMLYGTPLEEKLPPEILKQSGKEIIRYLLSQESDAPKFYFNESKMIIVGQGHVGKSSLLNRLIHNKFEDSGSTEGIDISSWSFTKNGQKYKLNVWDFGGQEIYHSTHQFFLTKRSLYLLVWDALAEDEYGRIDYWLKTIQSLAGDSPIIIVVNKCDNDLGRLHRLDDVDYKERFPQILDIVYVSCKDNIGISSLRKRIKDISVNLPLMKTSWLSSWMRIRETLEKTSKQRNFISYKDYLKICSRFNVDVEEAKSLIKYLNDLGIVLYYYDDPILKNIVILSSEWGTDAVYKVLDEQEKHLKGRNGILNADDLQIIWNDTTAYPPERHIHLISLMKKFQLIFDISESKYLVAELLENKTISLDYSFPKGDSLAFRYEYDFVPAGVMTRFIVSINRYLETINGVKQCWKKGAYLRYHDAYALVRLHDNLADRYIEIKVGGTKPRERQELLTIIRTTFEEINNQYNQINITEQIPCTCSDECTWLFDYKKVLLAESKGKQIVQCQNTFEDVDIRKLLDGVETKMETNYGPVIKNIYMPQNNLQNSPTITVSANSVAESSASTTVTVEIKDLINGLQGDFNDLLGEMVNRPKEFEEECAKVTSALESLDSCNTKEEITKTGALKKIERFLIECADPESKTGKLISEVKYAAGIVKELASKYNKIAKWLALPQIPFVD